MQYYFLTVHYGGMLKMREEKVTITILKWLQNNGWQIICFDFPQSGTGVSLHPNQDLREKTKNKGAIIPDIVANKDKISLFFENKDRFVLSDFQKINLIKTGGDYDNSIAELLKNYPTDEIYYGIGLPNSKLLEKKLNEHEYLVDFIVSVSSDLEIEILKGEELFKK
jgi:hypothetical protein